MANFLLLESTSDDEKYYVNRGHVAAFRLTESDYGYEDSGSTTPALDLVIFLSSPEDAEIVASIDIPNKGRRKEIERTVREAILGKIDVLKVTSIDSTLCSIVLGEDDDDDDDYDDYYDDDNDDDDDDDDDDEDRKARRRPKLVGSGHGAHGGHGAKHGVEEDDDRDDDHVEEDIEEDNDYDGHDKGHDKDKKK